MKTKKSINKELQKFLLAVEQTADSIFITNREGIIEYVNPAFEQMTGYTEKEALGHTPRIIKSGFQGLKYYKKLWSTILSGKDFRSTVVNRKKNGTLFYADHTITPIRDEKGNVTDFVGIWKDITKAVELEKRREHFLAIAAHELKNPITTIKGYCELLKPRLIQNKDHKNRYFLSQIEFQTDRVINLISNFFDVSRIETGKLIFEIKKLDFDRLIAKTVNSFKYSIDTHHIILQGKTRQKVMADPDRIEQVVVNLLSNAMKYSPKSSKIIVKLEPGKDFVMLSVTDFGIGIPRDKIKMVFDRFYQIQQHSGGGFGLGLYIASEIIKRHKGKIWIESKEGQGSTFYFSLPSV